MRTVRRHLTTRAAATAAVATLALGGCSMLGGEDSDGGSSSSEDSGGGKDDGEDGDSGGDSDGSGSDEVDKAAAEAGVDPKKPPKPIASVTMPGTDEADHPTDMTVDLISLKRQDKLMVLTVGVTPDKASKAKPDTYFGWTANTFSPQVVDTKNLKVHNVVKDDSGGYVYTPGMSTEFGPGQTFYMYAVLAAPPKDVDTVTVKAVDGAPAFTGVKVQ